jgi:putative colanic acid biosynthesis acetyltransferase WcaF
MKSLQVSMTDVRHNFSLKNKISRVLWKIVYILFFKPFSLRVFRKWRTFLLNLFGAQVDYTCTVHANVKIWAPWNLIMEPYSCLGPNVDCYNQGKVTIKKNAIVSQKTYLCASSHDFTKITHPLFTDPIVIEEKAWVAADAFIGPGVTIKKGAVVGARSGVFKNVEEWTVVGGNPAKFIKKRVLN